MNDFGNPMWVILEGHKRTLSVKITLFEKKLCTSDVTPWKITPTINFCPLSPPRKKLKSILFSLYEGLTQEHVMGEPDYNIKSFSASNSFSSRIATYLAIYNPQINSHFAMVWS